MALIQTRSCPSASNHISLCSHTPSDAVFPLALLSVFDPPLEDHHGNQRRIKGSEFVVCPWKVPDDSKRIMLLVWSNSALWASVRVTFPRSLRRLRYVFPV